jgi:hypothetical protein
MANSSVIQASQSGLNFMNTLQSQQSTAFAGNQAALTSLSNAWAPVLSTGAVPYGYSAGLDSLLQTNIRNNDAQATANAENASALQEKQASGGANVLPSGSQEAVNAEIEAKGQQTTATNLASEKEAGYQQGITNLTGATQAESAIASGENETGLASGATGAGSLGLAGAEAQWQENQGSSPAAILGDIDAGEKDAAGGMAIAGGF